MIKKNKNKVLSVDNVSEVQLKLYCFDEYRHGERKNRKNKNRDKKENIQSKLDVGDFVHPEIEISDDYTAKFFIDENRILNCINPVCPDCKSNNIVKGSLYSKKVVSEDFDGSIVMRRYKCKKCNRTFHT